MSDRPLGADHPAPWRLIVLAVWDRTVAVFRISMIFSVRCKLSACQGPRDSWEFRFLDIIVFLPSLCVFVRHSDDHPIVATYDEFFFCSQPTVTSVE